MSISGSSASPRRTVRPSSLVAAALALLLLGGCGGGGSGGGGGGGSPPAVSIATTALPSGGLGVPYSVALTATGGTSPYAWSIASGSTLPPGISLTPTGLLTGAPMQLGSFGFSVNVLDATSASDTASYSLVVSPFTASIALLHFGDAWTGEGYPLSATGGAGTTFTLVSNVSGGTITSANPSVSTARYVAGTRAGTDRIRATGSSGITQDLDVSVVANPVANMTGRFSTTDVWHLRFEGKVDAAHAFASDFDEALSIVGLRVATSTTGSTADELAKLYVRQQTLAYLNVMYGNASDGSPLNGGLKISFPFDEPDAPHVAPADGAIVSPAVNQFNVISMIAGDTSGVVGTAWLDETSNNSQENDTTTKDAGSLGVFVDELAGFFNGPYGNSQLPAAPVGPADVPALKALLYGQASPGGRYAELKRIGEGFGRTLAAVAAHEIGHSLGLDHTVPSVTGSIMNAAAVISASASYVFVPADFTILTGGLPGPGRGGSPQHVGTLRIAAPGEGAPGFAFQVCGCRVYRHARVAVPASR